MTTEIIEEKEELSEFQILKNEIEKNNNVLPNAFSGNRSFFNPIFLGYLFFRWHGRINRTEFLLGYCLIISIIISFLFIIENEKSIFSNTITPFYFSFVFLLYIIGSTSLQIKRLHDLDRSGWNILGFFFLPLAILLFFFLFFKEGAKHENCYGPKPR